MEYNIFYQFSNSKKYKTKIQSKLETIKVSSVKIPKRTSSLEYFTNYNNTNDYTDIDYIINMYL